MHDVYARLGATVADLVRAGRVLEPDHLDGLLVNVTVEIAAAMMEEDARRKAVPDATLGRTPKGNVLPFVLPGSGCASKSTDT